MKEYVVPEICLCRIESCFMIAVSPTGEDYSEPEEYGGF